MSADLSPPWLPMALLFAGTFNALVAGRALRDGRRGWAAFLAIWALWCVALAGWVAS